MAGRMRGLYRRAMLDDVGGFDEEFFAYADDAELGLRARMAGWTMFVYPRRGGAASPGRDAGLGFGPAADVD